MDHHLSGEPSPRAVRRHVYQNLVLTAIAGLLALGFIDRTAGQPGIVARLMSPSSASAQSSDGGELGNALQQRKEIIAELRVLNGKIDRIDAKMSQGINVKVLDMPALKLPPELRVDAPKPGKTDSKPDTKTSSKEPPAISVKVSPEK
jgi:hypothetical protein